MNNLEFEYVWYHIVKFIPLFGTFYAIELSRGPNRQFFLDVFNFLEERMKSIAEYLTGRYSLQSFFSAKGLFQKQNINTNSDVFLKVLLILKHILFRTQVILMCVSCMLCDIHTLQVGTYYVACNKSMMGTTRRVR